MLSILEPIIYYSCCSEVKDKLILHCDAWQRTTAKFNKLERVMRFIKLKLKVEK